MGGQALTVGLVDEVAMDVVAMVFGSGKQYFGPVDAQHLLEDPHIVVQGRRVLRSAVSCSPLISARGVARRLAR